MQPFGPTLADDAATLLDYVVEQGIVDVRITPFNDDVFPFELFVDLPEAYARGVGDSQAYELSTDAKSRRWRESNFEPLTQPNMAQWWAVELARIVVPFGEVGFVESCEQVLYDVDGNYFPTNSVYWGSPFFADSDVDDCRWYLTIDNISHAGDARFNRTSVAAFDSTVLPGSPYPDKYEIAGIWYPAHNSSANHLKWIVPHEKVLRFFFFTPPTAIWQWRAAGRLRAYTQSTFSPEAAANARRNI